jgi:hypothetical protein
MTEMNVVAHQWYGLVTVVRHFIDSTPPPLAPGWFPLKPTTYLRHQPLQPRRVAKQPFRALPQPHRPLRPCRQFIQHAARPPARRHQPGWQLLRSALLLMLRRRAAWVFRMFTRHDRMRIPSIKRVH